MRSVLPAAHTLLLSVNLGLILCSMTHTLGMTKHSASDSIFACHVRDRHACKTYLVDPAEDTCHGSLLPGRWEADAAHVM